jgi:hypothetical protein
MGYLTFNTWSNRVVIISSQGYFNSVQYRDGHISTCSIKTIVIYFYCVYCVFSYRYSLFIYCCFIINRCCSFILFMPNSIHSLFDFCSFFIVQKRKDSILILDCIPGISILRTTSSMLVNKSYSRLHRLCLRIGAKDLLRS